MATHRTAESVREMEQELRQLRQALQDIATMGRTLVGTMPVTRQVPGALAQGAVLTLTGLAEAALAHVGGSTT